MPKQCAHVAIKFVGLIATDTLGESWHITAETLAARQWCHVAEEAVCGRSHIYGISLENKLKL